MDPKPKLEDVWDPTLVKPIWENSEILLINNIVMIVKDNTPIDEEVVDQH